ncbi:MAG: helicase-related protein [Fusobacteriaceae bacterium]
MKSEKNGITNEIIEKMNEVLRNKKKAIVNIVNDKLTISVFTLLEKNLKNVKEINFVIRDAKFIPTSNEISHEFEITPNDILYSSYDITEKNKLKHFAQSKAMHDFIKNYVNIRKISSKVKVGGNILLIDDDFMIQGSSSLEILDSKKGVAHNINFDTYSTDKAQINRNNEVFRKMWYNNDVTTDYKNNLLESLEYVYKEHSPEFIYYFTLNELFGYQLDNGLERFERDSEKLKKTDIWNSLFDFQKDCVVSAIQKLQKYNGCIIADSVGLGKTFEALAIIKYFEIKMDNVLVLTPAKLYDNWNSFRGNYKDSLIKEVFNYKIMYHTDLSRYKGISKSGQDLKRFDWGNYDLVVIDESHNFRNRKDRYGEDDRLIMNRYARLLEDVVKRGKNNTKVLLLSATPVNNSLVDLKNQLSLITADKDSAFSEYGIPSIEYILRKSSTIINNWEKELNHEKNSLLDSLPSDFYKLLEMMTISRSRKHITGYYGNSKVGNFPQKNKPETYYPEIDTKEVLLKFKDANNWLEELNLSVYTPTKYIKGSFLLYYAEKYNLVGKHGGKLDFQTQSKGMIVLHRFNLFKRLESSVFSFSETLKRMLDRVDRTLEILYKGGEIDEELDIYDEEEPTYIEGKYQIDVKHLRVGAYIEDLENDKLILKELYMNSKVILDEERDKKIKELEQLIINKIEKTPYNKENKKIIIFTAFADTAEYIYSKLSQKILKKGVYTASVTGKGINTTNKNIDKDFNSILCAFSPKSKMKKTINESEGIDILIGTDCISEGQNLQDCDTVINFDIQWNPVSLIQRFGRIDRIGSENTNIQMINFFPNIELNEYLGLEQRVKGKMTTLNLVSTGDEDVLSPELNDFNFRKRQLERLKDEVIEIEDTNDNISLTDLNMNEYLYELSQYTQNNQVLKEMPKGIYSVTDGGKKGVLFCFKHRNMDEKPKSDSSLYPYYLIYLGRDGDILYSNSQAREVVKLFRKLCYGKKNPILNLLQDFFEKTKNANDMVFYSKLLNKAISSIKGEEEEKAVETVFDFGGFSNNFLEESDDDFELISFLVVG